MDNYRDFLKSKEFKLNTTGIDVKLSDIDPLLFDFQKDIVKWAVKLGRAAIWADCGMGKTLMQLEWARLLNKKTLILAPLAVSKQTIKEAEKLNMKIYDWRETTDKQFTIANYENIEKLPINEYEAIVLDESSILKSFTGKYRTKLIELFVKTPYKLACSATPAPNDFIEIGNHAEFLNIIKADEMLSMFFINDLQTVQKWRLKKHAKNLFWQWIASWAICIRKPSDLGYSDETFQLPELNYIQHTTESKPREGYLFVTDAGGLSERLQARKDSLVDRCKVAADIINNSDEQFLVWCNLNAESETIKKLIPGAVEIKGSDKPDVKSERMLDFSDSKIKVLITKPSIAGFGMNWQQCSNMVFLGLSDSYESLYQATRRCWRFGQKKDVNVHLVISQAEGAILKNVQRKDKESNQLFDRVRPYLLKKDFDMNSMSNKEDSYNHDKFQMYNGDCVEKIKLVKDESVGFSVFSPPFASLFTYSSDLRDMGNCSGQGEFFENFQFLIKELYRVMQPGRNVAVHCMNLPTIKVRDGFIGITDFRGDIIRQFQKQGFIYHSEICIWKDPVVAMQRTKALGLLYKQLKKDSAMSRMGIPDYIVVLRKPGVNKNPIAHSPDDLPCNLWQKYASPIWDDINQSDTLQYRSAREHDDEKHICPLQLDVIKRCLHLYSNKDDLVLSPFAGIGSEGYVSLEHGRKFVGIELKTSYYKQAVNNLLQVADKKQLSFF